MAQSPGGTFAKARGIVDNGELDPLTRFFFFRAASQYDSNRISEMLVSSGVVCDRYVFSTFAYHAAMDKRIRSLCDFTGLKLPDRTFLLVTREDVRLKRLRRRRRITKIQIDLATQRTIDRIYRKFDFDVIDTSDTSVEETTDYILSHFS